MAFGGLRKWLEEASAQVNPFDGGRTAQTVRATRQPKQPSGTDGAIRSIHKQIKSGGLDRSVGAAKIRALSLGDSVFDNTASQTLQPQGFFEAAGQKVVNNAFNPKIAPITLGIGRSATGTGEGLSGLYDLATPGKGTNRFGKGLTSYGKTLDDTVKGNDFNKWAYKGAQLGTDVATFMVPGAKIKTAPLLKNASRPAKYFSRPDVLTDIAVDTAMNSGLRSNRGQDVSPGSVALDAATSAAFAGGINLAGQGVNKGVVQPALRTLRNNQIVAPSRLTPSELADLRALNEQARTGALMDEGVYQRGVAAADRAGIDYRNPTQIDNLLGAHRTYDTRVGERKQKVQEVQDKVVKPVYADESPHPNKGVSSKDSVAPITVYHGGAGVGEMRKNGVKILSPEEKLKYPSSGGGFVGLSTTADRNYAQQFSRAIAGTDDTLEVKIKPDAKVLELPDGKMIDDMSADELSKLSKKYDVIKSAEDNEYRILNERAIQATQPKVKDSVAPEQLARTGKRDGLPLETLKKVDDNFIKDTLPNNKLDYDNEGRFFDNPEASRKKIERNIRDIQSGKKLEPIIIDEKGNILDGQHRMSAYEALGIKDIPVYRPANKPMNFDNLRTRKQSIDGRDIEPQFFKATQPTKGARDPESVVFQQNPMLPENQPKGFIISETKPRNGRKDTVRIRTDENGQLIKTTQSEPVAMTDKEWGNLMLQTDTELPSPTKVQEPAAPPTKADRKKQTQEFMAMTNEYLGAEKSGQIGAVDVARKYNEQFGGLSDKQKLDVILTLDGMGSSKDPQVQAAAEYLSRQYDESFRYFTQDKGINMGFRQDYSPRIYQDENGNTLNAQEYKALIGGSKRQKGRTSELLDTERLVTKDPAELLQKYHTSLEKAAAGKRYLAQLQESGMLVTADDPSTVRGMKPIVAEGMLADGTIYYAKPDVADKLNRIFGSQEASGFFEKSLEKAAGFNSFVQSFVLSGGIPNTPINAFGIMQLMKNGMALHPVQGGRAFFTGLSRKHATKFFDNHADYMKLMADNGLDVRYDYSLKPNKGMVRIKQAADERGVGGVINEGWNELTNDATFGRFMPALEVLHFRGVYDGLIKKGVDPQTAGNQAAGATANFFGKNTLAKDATGSRVARNAAGAALFAPRFRESMLNFWVKNAKALKPGNMTKVEYRDNIKFMTAAAATFAAMEGANKALTGEWMHDNPDGKKDKLLIPGGDFTGGKFVGIPFLPSIATVPRNAVMAGVNSLTGNFDEAGKNLKSFASMPLQTAGELLTNEDYFGGRIYDPEASAPERLMQAGSFIAKDNSQPWIREGLNTLGQNLPEDTKKMLGIREQSGFETISKATEAPLRFYDPAYFRNGKGNLASAPSATTSDSDRDEIIRAALGNKLGKEFMKLRNDDQRKDFANQSDENRAIYDQYQAMKKGLESTVGLKVKGLNQASQKVLDTFDSLTDEGKEQVIAREPRMEYELELAKYNRDRAEGKLSKVDEIKKGRELATLEIAVNFDKEVREIAGLSKAQVFGLITTDPNGQYYADNLLKYYDQLVDKGLVSDHPYRDKWGNVDFDPARSGGGGRSKKGGVNLPNIAVGDVAPKASIKISQINAPKVGGLRMSKPNIKVAKARTFKTRK